MDTRKSTIICLACILIGLCLQFCFKVNLVTPIIGSLLVMFGPRLVTKDYTKEFKLPQNSGGVSLREKRKEMLIKRLVKDGIKMTPEVIAKVEHDIDELMAKDKSTQQRWKTFDAETGCQYIKSWLDGQCRDLHDLSLIDSLVSLLSLSQARIVVIILGGCLIAANEGQIGSLIIDAIYVPLALFYLKYGVSPEKACHTEFSDTNRDVVRNQAIMDIATASLQNTETFEIHPQFRLVRERGFSEIVDSKIELQYKEKYRDVLCTMISISLNSVMSTIYAYAYFVIVIKGDVNSQLMEMLQSRLCHSQFSLDVKMEDGNAIYVITKTSGVDYQTTETDYKELLLIVNSTAEYLRVCCGVVS